MMLRNRNRRWRHLFYSRMAPPPWHPIILHGRGVKRLNAEFPICSLNLIDPFRHLPHLRKTRGFLLLLSSFFFETARMKTWNHPRLRKAPNMLECQMGPAERTPNLWSFATIKHHQSLEYLQIRHVFLVQLGLFQAAFEMAAATDVAAMFRTGLGMEQMVAPPKHRSGGVTCRICLKLAAEIDFGASLRGKLMSSHWLLEVLYHLLDKPIQRLWMLVPSF